jgi:CHAT domain-containing protein/Flp pilus assembly protein TadD
MVPMMLHIAINLKILIFLVYIFGSVGSPTFANNKLIYQLRSEASSLLDADRLTEAIPLLEKYTNLLAEKFGYGHHLYLGGTTELAIVYNATGRLEKAEKLLTESLAGTIAILGSDHPNISYISNALGDVYYNKFQFNLAERYYLEAVAVEDKSMTSKNPRKGSTFLNLAQIQLEKGDYDQAQKFIERSFDFISRIIDEQSFILALNTLAKIHLGNGNINEAKKSLDRSLNILNRVEGSKAPKIRTQNDYGILALEIGDYVKAEDAFNNALSISERIFGIDSRLSTTILHNLGYLYASQSRTEEALSIYQLVLEIEETKYGSSHPALAKTLFQISQIYLQNADVKLATVYLDRSYKVAKKAYGQSHPMIAKILSSQGWVKENLGDYKAAEDLYLLSIKLWDGLPGVEPWQVYNNLGALYLNAENFDLSEYYFKKALSINLEVFGEKNPNNITLLCNLAYLSYVNGDRLTSLDYFRDAADIMRNRINNLADYNVGILSERQSEKQNFVLYAELALEFYADTGLPEYLNEAFEATQLIQVTKAGEALKSSSKILKLRDKYLYQIWRKKLVIDEKIRQADMSFMNHLTNSTVAISKRKISAARKLRDELERSRVELLSKLEAHSLDDFSVSNQIVSVAKTQKLMKKDEILIKIIPSFETTLVFALTKNSAIVQIAKIPEKKIDEMVHTLREGLEIKQNENLPKFDVALAHELYLKLIKPLNLEIRGISHISLSSLGSLNTLPLGVLPVALPEFLPDGDYGAISWLGEKYSISNVLSISALVSTRNTPPTKTQNPTFLGIGDPKLNADEGLSRGLSFADGKDNVESSLSQKINELPNLPETRMELTNIAKFFGEHASTLLLGDNANEDQLKLMELAKFSVISFATHALLANELKGIREPGIVLTPPISVTELNDGVLTATEIAQLELNADWVILSACNTAAADGELSNEAFSGLARSFFYAGTRTILASHWPVASQPTAEFVNLIIEEYFKKNVGKAEAHKRAIKTFVQAQNELYSHPSIWGPFSIIGDGS